jgi:hypothetical protein
MGRLAVSFIGDPICHPGVERKRIFKHFMK